ncbi:MAG: CaiB/BaiF CoA transferase family protein [Nitrososphaerales archaeon]
MDHNNRGPLAGLTVIEVSSLVAGPAMGSLFQSLGAQVIKIEQPGLGDPSRSVSPWGFLNYNYGKKSVSLNLKEKEGQEILHSLMKNADVFIENLGPDVGERLGFSYSVLSSINPRLVYCSIKGFSSKSELYDRPAFDAVAQAMSGMMSLTGEPGGEPLRVGNPSIDLGAASYGAVGVLAYLLDQRNVEKKGVFLEISLLDMSVYWNGYWLTYFGITGNLPQRLGSGHLGYCPHRVFKTKDKEFLFVATLNDSQWAKLQYALGLKLGEEYAKMNYRVKNRAIVEDEVEREISKLTLAEALALLKQDVPCARVNSVSDVYSDQELESRGVLVETDYEGKKVKVVVPPVRTGESFSFSRPELGQDTKSVLLSLGYDEARIKRLKDAGIV